MLKDESIGVVHNCTPNNLHYEINKACLEHGKHILSEKPLCLDAERARRLVVLAEKNKLQTAVNYCYRYYPSVQEAAMKIEKRYLGKGPYRTRFIPSRLAKLITRLQLETGPLLFREI